MGRSISRILSLPLLSLLVCLLLSPGDPAFGQGGNAQLNGLITDSSGASVPGVKVTIVNTATNDRTSFFVSTSRRVFVNGRRA
jgi:hypothetical protein